MKKNTLYYGDCMEVMNKWDDNSIDLIYLDPPFNSQVNYNILFGTQRNGGDKNDLAQLTAFTDTWEWDENAEKRVRSIKNAISHPAHRAICAFGEIYPDGSGMLSYLSYMAERLAAMHRLLKETGNIYLHCDPTASHYLKIIMDEVFGKENFGNEVIWHYGKWTNTTAHFQQNHDVLFVYAKNKGRHTFNKLFKEEASPHYEKGWHTNIVEGGISQLIVYDKKKAREKIESGKYDRVIYREGKTNAALPDVWEIPIINPMAKERLGYPTQKPLALLKQIIMASSNEGDLVLDPFCGCGTTVEAAHSLKRNWIGIDISAYAIEVVRRERMKDLRIDLAGVPKDLKGATDFSIRNPFDFEKWAVTRIRGFAPNKVQRGDGGIDGRALIFGAEKDENLCIAQVKGGKPSIESLRAFSDVIAKGKAAIGVFITLEKWDTPSVKKCLAQAGTFQRGETEFRRLVMYTIDEYFQGIEPKLPPLAHPRTGEAFHEELKAKEVFDG